MKQFKKVEPDKNDQGLEPYTKCFAKNDQYNAALMILQSLALTLDFDERAKIVIDHDPEALNTTFEVYRQKEERGSIFQSGLVCTKQGDKIQIAFKDESTKFVHLTKVEALKLARQLRREAASIK